MKVKNNYNECLTNLACSIRKYFGLNYKHNTLTYIDEIFEKDKPDNVVLILFDGMGSNILKRSLPRDAFLIKNDYKDITTVFPATTTAATTSIRTGLNPIEHGCLGWNMYIKLIDKTITLFMNTEKGKEEVCKEFLNVKHKLVSKTIADEINECEKFSAMELFPFPTGNAVVYKDLDDMLRIILEETKKEGKRFIYAYDSEPDHTMHDFGPDSDESRSLITERNNKIEALCKELKNTLVIIVADHGHMKVEHIFLEKYSEIVNMLERTTSLEQRAVSFKVKSECIKEFPMRFNKLFGEWFDLYEAQEIIDSKLFGEGNANELFYDALGDFIAIANDSSKCIVTEGNEILYSQHAGYSNDEVYVPIIVIEK